MSSDVNSLTEQLSKTTVEEKKEISFAGKGLKLNTENDAKEIVKTIKEAPVMTALQMEGNTMGCEAAKVIGEALEGHPEFKRALWSDMFTGRLKSEIPQALKYLCGGITRSGAGLVELNLSDNAFGPNGVEGFKDFIKSESCYTLKELKLNNNGLGVTGGKMLAESLLECHKASSAAGRPLALKVFISGRNRLENPGATALAEAFKAMGSLEHVAMPQNGIQHEGIEALADAFAECKNLKVLNLNDNIFTAAGANAIARAIPHLQELEVINFGDCLVRSKGVRDIAKAINGTHKKLRELILSGNEIGKRGAKFAAEALQGKEAFDKLELGSNQLGEAGVERVKCIAEKHGKKGCLDSLSDDEGTDDEGDDDELTDDDDDDDGQDESAKDDQEGDVMPDPALRVEGKAIELKPDLNVTAKDFLLLPTEERLLGLGPDRARKLTEELKDDLENVEKMVHTFIRISSVVKVDGEKTREAAAECADALLHKLYEGNNKDTTAILATNVILVRLGLLKGEDKITYNYDLTGPLLIMSHVVKQSYFPKVSRDVLQLFLSKPNPKLDKCAKARHALMQVLYQF
ncbi:ran GTPase-activating protein 1-like [Lineus longissimus]|uniref:ran GTPase-activating protein 1-like n=1 Tax=Lineus longissimus TaxID=88925 RepID=UPI002B4C94E8